MPPKDIQARRSTEQFARLLKQAIVMIHRASC